LIVYRVFPSYYVRQHSVTHRTAPQFRRHLQTCANIQHYTVVDVNIQHGSICLLPIFFRDVFVERKTLALCYDRNQAYCRNTSAADSVPEETFEPDFVPTFRVVETSGHSELFAIIYLGQCPPFFGQSYATVPRLNTLGAAVV